MKCPPLVYVRGTKIVVKGYLRFKEQIDEFCSNFACGYDIRKDGSAVIICD